MNEAVRRVLLPVRTRLLIAVGLQAGAGLAHVGSLLCAALLAAGAVRAGEWTPGLWTWLWWAAGLLILSILLAGTASALSHVADNVLLLTLRQRMAAHLTRVRLGWFTSRGGAQVKKVIQDDTAAMHHLVAHALLDVTAVVIVPLAAFVALLVIEWTLAAAALMLAGAAYLLFHRAMSGAGQRMAEYGRAMEELNSAAVEAVEGVDVVRTFSSRENRPSRLRRASAEFHDFFLGWVGETRLITAVAFVLASPLTSILILAGLGAALILSGRSDLAGVIPALVLGPLVSAPVNTIGTRIQALRRGISSAEAIDALCHEEVLPSPVETARPDGTRLEVRSLGFSYDQDTPVLRDLSFTVEPGSLTAIVGGSGAGKTTLAGLLARFEDPDSGSIELGGANLRRLSPEVLYTRIGFVFQDVVLLRESVWDVIRMGRTDISDDAVQEAAREANIHDRIMGLPLGYDSEVGRDIEFSGGEAQRIAVARALLADAPVLILDEATSYADPESEAQVQEALSRLAEGRTVIVIAHRLHTVRNADQILVLEHGRLAESGTHEELIAREGPYLRLWQESDRKVTR